MFIQAKSTTLIVSMALVLGVVTATQSQAQNVITQEDFKDVPQGLVTGGTINNNFQNRTPANASNQMNRGRGTYHPHNDGYSYNRYRYNRSYNRYPYNRSYNRYAPTDRHHPDTDWVDITY